MVISSFMFPNFVIDVFLICTWLKLPVYEMQIYEFWQMHIVMYHTEQFYFPPNSLVLFFCSNPFLQLQTPVTTYLFLSLPFF